MAFYSYTSVFQLYDDWLKTGDPRVEDWLLMSSPFPQTFITTAYLFFVTFLGPRLMENRKPFELKKVMFIYNVCISSFCLYMFYEFLMSGWATGYSFRCDIVDYSNSPKALRMAKACWLYYFFKFIEMLDTIFFVIRKKTAQLTFLHIYHHIVAAYTLWFVVKFAAGCLRPGANFIR
ncbi:elongation of very long chain fatty acids protein 7-like [Sardina pilchardus]|uniref:elongation of very long chain fatty acids protein 7-like n=1 Tax=Sardina pilchardus TaxID=27697 RepID=UPI002E0F924E